MENIFMIYRTPHIVKGITNERIIFQALKSDSYYNNPSYKIKFNSYKGYYITVPQVDGYKDISLVDIFKSFEMYNKLKKVEQLRGEFI